MHATREISCGLRARSKAAPLQASGTNTSCQRASAFEHEDEYEGRGTPFTLIFFSFGKAHALRYFWNTTVNTSSTLTLSARPSAGLFSVYFFYFWWGSNSF
jgi:hypothetical protein